MPAVRRSVPAPLGILVPLVLLVLLAGCGSEPDAPGALVMDQHEYERWEIDLVEMRIEKNEAFADPATSPLPADQVAGFEALNYYLPAPELRFRTPLRPAAAADTVQLAKRKGQLVPYVRRGTVAFRHDGRVHELAVFGPVGADADARLWLPFHDASNRTDTYAGGRYLDLDVDADGMIDLDFNRAYNPLCDYNPDRYNCTLPPRENTLPFAVAAGEKRYSATH